MTKRWIERNERASARLRRPTLIAGWVCVVILCGYLYIAVDRAPNHKFVPALVVVLMVLVAALAWAHRRGNRHRW